MGVNSLPKTVTRQRRGCDLNPGPTAPEPSPLTARLPSHPLRYFWTLSGRIRRRLSADDRLCNVLLNISVHCLSVVPEDLFFYLCYFVVYFFLYYRMDQCFDAAGWAAERASGL